MDLLSDFEVDDTAVWFDLPNLKTGGTHVNPFSGEPVQWQIRSPDSVEMTAFETKANAKTTKMALAALRRGPNAEVDNLESDKISTDRAIVALVGWRNFPGKSGEDIPFTPENVRSLFTGAKTRWMRDWVESLVKDRGNFSGATTPSGGTPQTPKK